jgi:uncharacterized protein (TIGR03435 family)
MRYAAILLLAAAPVFGGVKVGDAAPPIHLQALIPDRPVDTSLNALKGKAVVLEFWATWCAPCLDAIPHLNELVDRFAGKGIQFISVTDEDPAVVEESLKTTPIHGWVGIDHTKAMFKAYGFEGVPDTVLIGADGKFAGTVNPALLKASHIEDLLAGRPVKLPVIFPDLSIARVGDDGPPALLDMIVRPSTGGGGFTPGATKFQAKGLTIRWLMASATHVPFDYVVGEAADDTTRYDVSLTAPGANPVAFGKLIPDILCTALHVTIRRETRDIDGWILKAPHGKPEGLKEPTTHSRLGRVGRGEFSPTGASMGQLADLIRGVVQKPVADQTGISGRFDLTLKYDDKQPESLLDALRGLGFTVEPGVVPTEFLVVSK